MGHVMDEQSVFKVKPSKAESKADITTGAARAIIDDEAARREAKTDRLRQARLENEAKLAAIKPAAKPKAKAKKTAVKRRAKPAK